MSGWDDAPAVSFDAMSITDDWGAPAPQAAAPAATATAMDTGGFGFGDSTTSTNNTGFGGNAMGAAATTTAAVTNDASWAVEDAGGGGFAAIAPAASGGGDWGLSDDAGAGGFGEPAPAANAANAANTGGWGIDGGQAENVEAPSGGGWGAGGDDDGQGDTAMGGTFENNGADEEPAPPPRKEHVVREDLVPHGSKSFADWFVPQLSKLYEDPEKDESEEIPGFGYDKNLGVAARRRRDAAFGLNDSIRHAAKEVAATEELDADGNPIPKVKRPTGLHTLSNRQTANHKWTDYEIYLVICMLARSLHMKDDDTDGMNKRDLAYRRRTNAKAMSEIEPSARSNSRIQYTVIHKHLDTELRKGRDKDADSDDDNESPAKDKPDISLRDVRDMVDNLLADYKHPADFMHRVKSAKMTRAVHMVWKRDKLTFYGSMNEWNSGRKEEEELKAKVAMEAAYNPATINPAGGEVDTGGVGSGWSGGGADDAGGGGWGGAGEGEAASAPANALMDDSGWSEPSGGGMPTTAVPAEGSAPEPAGNVSVPTGDFDWGATISAASAVPATAFPTEQSSGSGEQADVNWDAPTAAFDAGGNDCGAPATSAPAPQPAVQASQEVSDPFAAPLPPSQVAAPQGVDDWGAPSAPAATSTGGDDWNAPDPKIPGGSADALLESITPARGGNNNIGGLPPTPNTVTSRPPPSMDIDPATGFNAERLALLNREQSPEDDGNAGPERSDTDWSKLPLNAQVQVMPRTTGTNNAPLGKDRGFGRGPSTMPSEPPPVSVGATRVAAAAASGVADNWGTANTGGNWGAPSGSRTPTGVQDWQAPSGSRTPAGPNAPSGDRTPAMSGDDEAANGDSNGEQTEEVRSERPRYRDPDAARHPDGWDDNTQLDY